MFFFFFFFHLLKQNEEEEDDEEEENDEQNEGEAEEEEDFKTKAARISQTRVRDSFALLHLLPLGGEGVIVQFHSCFEL